MDNNTQEELNAFEDATLLNDILTGATQMPLQSHEGGEWEALQESGGNMWCGRV